MGVERIIEHWWNKSWAGLWKRDAWLRTDGTNWHVDLRQGIHREPWRKTWTGPTAEADARAWLQAKLASTGDDWRDIAATLRPEL